MKSVSFISYLRIKIFFFFLFGISQIFAHTDRPSVLVLFSASANKVAHWNDGFVAAMRLLEKDYDVSYFNVATNLLCKHLPAQENFIDKSNIDFSAFEILLVKSNWGGPLHKFAKHNLKPGTPKALLISGVNHPTSSSLLSYDVLFYETEWYRKYIKKHPCIIHAFGINTDVMKPPVEPVNKTYDYIMVGAFHSNKRWDKLLLKKGNKLAVGSNSPNNPIHRKLEAAGVTVLQTVPPEELALLYHQSKCCYVASQLKAGGERNVLEARACGVSVEIEPDNPKLKELLHCPIYDQFYYAQQIKKGIEWMLSHQH